MAFDVEQTFQSILSSLKAEAGAAYDNITSFSQDELRLLLTEAAQYTDALAHGELTQAEFKAEMKNIDDQARIIAKAIAELIAITIQKAFDTINNTLRDAVRQALNAAGIGFLTW